MKILFYSLALMVLISCSDPGTFVGKDGKCYELLTKTHLDGGTTFRRNEVAPELCE